MGEHARPLGGEDRIVRSRRYGDVELGARGGAAPGFLRATRARVEVTAVLVDVGEDQVRIALESVIDAVAVMGIDIHVSNALQAVIPAQHFHRHAAVVENAETRGPAARGVMQPGDGNERAPRAGPMICSTASNVPPATSAAAS